MGLSSSIQFRDKEAVKQAYKNRDVDAWSIVCGKQFMFKGIGYDSFQDTIDLLAETDSNALYTAQVYEGIEDEKQIKNNTPCDGSFNFKFNEETARNYQIMRGIGVAPNEVVSKLNAIEERLNTMEEEPPRKLMV